MDDALSPPRAEAQRVRNKRGGRGGQILRARACEEQRRGRRAGSAKPAELDIKQHGQMGLARTDAAAPPRRAGGKGGGRGGVGLP